MEKLRYANKGYSKMKMVEIVSKLNEIVDWINEVEDKEVETLLKESVSLGNREHD